MKKLIVLAVLGVITVFSAPAFGAARSEAPSYGVVKINQDYSSDKAKKVKSVPEPAVMLLIGAAAAGLAGVRKLFGSKNR